MCLALGYNIFVSTDVTKAADKHILPVLYPEAVTFAGQITEMVPYRPQARFGDAVKMLYVFDASLIDARYLYHLDFFFDADG